MTSYKRHCIIQLAGALVSLSCNTNVAREPTVDCLPTRMPMTPCDHVRLVDSLSQLGHYELCGKSINWIEDPRISDAFYYLDRRGERIPLVTYFPMYSVTYNERLPLDTFVNEWRNHLGCQ